MKKRTDLVSRLKEESTGLAYAEEWHTIAMLDAFWQRESNFRVVELFDLGPAAISSFYNLHLDDLDGMSTSAMTSTHIPVTLSYCSAY